MILDYIIDYIRYILLNIMIICINNINIVKFISNITLVCVPYEMGNDKKILQI